MRSPFLVLKLTTPDGSALHGSEVYLSMSMLLMVSVGAYMESNAGTLKAAV